MPRLRAAERAMTLLASSPSHQQNYICRTCLLSKPTARRTLHTTRPLAAELSFLQRLQNSVFGSKESREASKKREEAKQKRQEELFEKPAQAQAQQQWEIVTDWRGREFEVAALVDENVEGYAPASSWEGMERIGSEEWVRARADGGEVYSGFAQPKKAVLLDDQWKCLLHHVAVEVLALRQAGRDLNQVCYQRTKRSTGRRTLGIDIVVTDDGVTLSANEGTSVNAVLAVIPETAQELSQGSAEVLWHEMKSAAGKRKVPRQEYRDVAQGDDAWMQLPLSDPAVKLAITKRLTQLTGHRPRDLTISTARTLSDLYTAYKTPEKPKKLHHSPQIHSLRADNPNVTVHTRRQTPIDKHKAVGRWKVIEDELKQRDLPVTGTRWKDAKTQMGTIGDRRTRKERKKSIREQPSLW